MAQLAAPGMPGPPQDPVSGHARVVTSAVCGVSCRRRRRRPVLFFHPFRGAQPSADNRPDSGIPAFIFRTDELTGRPLRDTRRLPWVSGPTPPYRLASKGSWAARGWIRRGCGRSERGRWSCRASRPGLPGLAVVQRSCTRTRPAPAGARTGRLRPGRAPAVNAPGNGSAAPTGRPLARDGRRPGPGGGPVPWAAGVCGTSPHAAVLYRTWRPVCGGP